MPENACPIYVGIFHIEEYRMPIVSRCSTMIHVPNDPKNLTWTDTNLLELEGTLVVGAPARIPITIRAGVTIFQG